MLKFSTFKKNFANAVTASGIFTTALCAVLIYDNGIKWIIPIFILALFTAFTDWADGQVARKFNVSSEMGGIVDKVRDKAFLFIFATWMFFRAWRISFIEGFSLVTLFAMIFLGIIMFVEAMLIVIEIVLLYQKKNAHPSKHGKRKMALYYIGILLWVFSLVLLEEKILLKESPFLVHLPVLVLSMGLYFGIRGFLNYAKRLSVATAS